MGNDARPMAAAIGFRPHVWLAVGFWVMTPFFLLMAFGLTLLAPAVRMHCTRQDGQTRCDVLTAGLVRPSIERLSDADLRGARLALAAEPHDGSFKQVELRRGASVRVLATYTRDARREAVGNLNGFLHETSPGEISAFIVGDRPTVFTRFGLFPFQLIALGMLAGGFYSLGRRTTFTITGDALEVRASRWPLEPRLQRRALKEIAGLGAVSRIPDGLAQVVASLPWRNIYRANALAIRTTSGQEVLLTEWSRRRRALHERLATTLRGWLADQGARSNRSS
jgi:hypothetical protein